MSYAPIAYPCNKVHWCTFTTVYWQLATYSAPVVKSNFGNFGGNPFIVPLCTPWWFLQHFSSGGSWDRHRHCFPSFVFTPATLASTVYMPWPRVCLSICLSAAGVLWRRLTDRAGFIAHRLPSACLSYIVTGISKNTDTSL